VRIESSQLFSQNIHKKIPETKKPRKNPEKEKRNKKKRKKNNTKMKHPQTITYKSNR